MLRLIKNIILKLIALSAVIYYGYPARKFKIIGVTGTDGKTTTTHLIYEILKEADFPVSMVSTISAVINGKQIDTGFHVTTPSPWQLQKLLKEAYLEGSKYFVLEVTSHALDQARILGTSIDIAVITNLSHEHLDYHGSLNEYRKAKARILTSAEFCVLNADDKNFSYFKRRAKEELVTFSLNAKTGDFNPVNTNFKTNLPGDYNIYNCLAAYAVAKILSVSDWTIKRAIKKFEGIPGRMEEIKTDKNFRIFIDFAHKPNALQSVMFTLRKKTDKKLIVIFGCAGERDYLKRPMMGRIAGKFADRIILTAEDPRSEDPRDIIDEIAKGCIEEKVAEGNRFSVKFIKENKKLFFRIPDRQEAINFAIRKLAQKGDTVVSCGKGHEKSMCYGTVEYPWDEKIAIEKALYGSVSNS